MLDFIKLSLLLSQSNSKPKISANGLQLSTIRVNSEYCEEWNESHEDFVVLTKNGELISNSLYRVGGLGGDITQDYFMLLKYVESSYEIDFLKKCYPKKSKQELESQRKHLEGCWCILDKNGVEKKVFDGFKNPYLTKNSCIYSIDNNYHNIETDEFYCKAYKSMESTDFVFLENSYDEDVSKRGIMKVNKKDGTWELFPSK